VEICEVHKDQLDVLQLPLNTSPLQGWFEPFTTSRQIL
jgi:hypothetical protein